MSDGRSLSRRAFVRVTAGSGAGLVLAFRLRGFDALGAVERPARPREAAAVPDAWIHIDADGTTRLRIGQSEMGQGVHTSLAMLLADELDADWERVRVEQAPTEPAYGNPALGGAQITIGSSSVPGFWQPLREAGAAARAMLVTAAAAEWGASATSLRTHAGAVLHPDGRRLDYGALAARAAALPVPTEVKLKEPSEYRFIGHDVARVDVPAKVNGTAVYGIDVELPGLLTAVGLRCPVRNGRVKSYDAAAASRIPGVRHVVQFSSGVAVVADGFWAAKRGRDALRVEWDEGSLATVDSTALRRYYAARAGAEGLVAKTVGDAERAIRRAARRLEVSYELPLLHHAPMEPMNATAHVTADRCEIWASTQGPAIARMAAAQITGLPAAAVHVHTTYLGGGFGRRVGPDVVAEAVELSKAVGAPVKMIWSREDDTRHGYYRPMSHHRLRAGLDSGGRPTGWSHAIATPSIFAALGPLTGVDAAAVEGASDMPYAIADLRVAWVRVEDGVSIGTWRSIGHSCNVFVVESFVDELAAAARADPYRYRRALLEKRPRHRAVLDLAAEKAAWDAPLPRGRARGIALSERGNTCCAQVAEVSVGEQGVRVHRVVCAIDCGTVVHPDGVRAQIEGGIMFGLSAALGEAITLRAGRVEQSSFRDYPIMRIDAAPSVDVHIVPSRGAPTGIGELGVPAIAPAVSNAIYAATGRRVRSLPFSKERLRRA